MSWTSAGIRIVARIAVAAAFVIGVVPASAEVTFVAGSQAGRAPVEFVGSSSQAVTGTSLVFVLPAGAAVDDVMIVQVATRGNPNVGIPAPAGWAPIGTEVNIGAGGNRLRQAAFYKVVTAADVLDGNATWSFPATRTATGGMSVFRGVDTATPIHNNSVFSSTAGAGTIVLPGFTTTVDGAMLVALYAVGADPGFTPPAGYAERYEQNNGTTLDVMAADAMQATAGATGTASATLSANSNRRSGFLIALTPATASLTLDVPAGTVGGDVMIAAVGVRPSSLTVTAPAGWTPVNLVTQGAGSSARLATYYRVATASEPANYTWTFSGANGGVTGSIASFRGADGAAPIDSQAGQATGGSLNHTAPSVTVSLGGAMLVTAHVYSSSSAWAPPPGMTEIADIASHSPVQTSGVTLGLYHEARASAGATGTRTATAASDADVGATQSIVLRPLVLPLAHWAMDEGAWSGAANEVQDGSGNGRHGSAVNGATTAGTTPAIGGDPGTCRYGTFNGVDRYVQVSNLSSILNGTASLAFWIRTTQTGNDTAWMAPGVTGVELAGGTSDIFWGWLDASGRIGVSVGDSFSNKSTTAINNGAWRHVVLTRDHVAGTYRIYIDGSLDNSGAIAAGTIGTTFSSIGRIEDTAGTHTYFNGLLDEVRVYDVVLEAGQVLAIMNQTHPCGSGFDHLRIEHPGGAGLTCNPSTLTVRACADASCTTAYTGGVTGTLTASGAPTVNWIGGASFTIPAGSSLVTHEAQVTTPGSVTFGTSGVAPLPSGASPVCDFGTPACTFTAADSGFVFGIPDHVAATMQNVVLAAVRTDDVTQRCVPTFQNTAKTVRFWSSYVNPDSGTLALGINGDNIAGASPGTAFALNFDNNGETTLQLRYPDVGLVALSARHDGTGDSAGLVMTGQDSFVARPARFALTVPGNPAAANAFGGVFQPAGEGFSVTVEARNASDAVTPNYGRESVPETVAMTKTLIAPLGGNDPALSGAFGSFGQDCNGDPASAGTACGNFSWPEVGIIALNPSVGDGDYLGAGDVSGTSSGNIGRFVPAYFDVAHTQGCSAGSFTYSGQPSLVTVTARGFAGNVTGNYHSAFGFAKNTTLSDADDVAGFSGNVIESASGFTNGVGTTYPVSNPLSGPNSPMTYTFTTKETAPVTLTLRATDTDSVSSSGHIEPTASMRSARLILLSAFGSEFVDLPVPMRVQTYIDVNTGWVTHTDDVCTAVTLAPLTGSVSAQTCVQDTGSPGLSGIGCAVAGPLISRFKEGATLAGDFNLVLRAPGAGNQGSADVTLDLSAMPWLRFDWDGDGANDNNPRARATFGLYPGSTRHIYTRERY